jgi:hypothetical protein
MDGNGWPENLPSLQVGEGTEFKPWDSEILI